ncbi:MAG TPA: enoyl-CoA hydratase-related protein [Rhizomicrobium sp.]|jgi:enoyl-CoA hydratase/carnithine racemase
MTAEVLLACADDVATLTLNRPDKRNALNEAMWAGLAEAVKRADAMPEAKIIVIRGAGGHFAAGADISEFAVVYASRERSAEYSRIVASGVSAIAQAAKPVIAVIEGSCVGGGMAIALACDLRIASTTAKCGITPAKLGIVYAFGDAKRLVDAVGPSKAKDIIFTGRIMDATEALSIGLVDEVHASGALEESIAAKCAVIAGNSQWSVRGTKEMIRLIMSGAASETPETTGKFLDAVEQADFREGRAAFMEKRTPKFPHR